MNKYTLAQVHDSIAWLDGRYRWHGEEEDKQCADMLRTYAAHLREREAAKAGVTDEMVMLARRVVFDVDEQIEWTTMRAALEAVAPLLASARVPDGWQPADAEVMAWMERSDIDNRSVSDMRTAIDDARSMHMLAAAPKRGEG